MNSFYMFVLHNRMSNATNHPELFICNCISAAEVSSVKLSYSCLSPTISKAQCSADGDNLRFSWTPGLNPVIKLEDGNSTFLLEDQTNVTCHVENNVSGAQTSTELHPCLGGSSLNKGSGNNNSSLLLIC